jgi:hypothetical protein
MAKSKRTALLIRCSVEEAEQIRAAARKQHRTLSGYVLHCLHRGLRIKAKLETQAARIAARRKTWVKDARY